MRQISKKSLPLKFLKKKTIFPRFFEHYLFVPVFFFLRKSSVKRGVKEKSDISKECECENKKTYIESKMTSSIVPRVLYDLPDKKGLIKREENQNH
jgi:hypothetical protein